MNKTEHIKFRIDKASKEKLRVEANKIGMTTAGYCRSLVLKSVNE